MYIYSHPQLHFPPVPTSAGNFRPLAQIQMCVRLCVWECFCGGSKKVASLQISILFYYYFPWPFGISFFLLLLLLYFAKFEAQENAFIISTSTHTKTSSQKAAVVLHFFILIWIFFFICCLCIFLVFSARCRISLCLFFVRFSPLLSSLAAS